MELLRPTAPQAAPEPGDEPAPPDDADAEGRGEATGDSQAAPARGRARKPAAGKAATRARNIRLSDDVHDRLWLLARQRKLTVSAVANDLLNKSLPRWELKRQG